MPEEKTVMLVTSDGKEIKAPEGAQLAEGAEELIQMGKDLWAAKLKEVGYTPEK